MMIGDGRNTLLFYDKWINNTTIFSVAVDNSINWGKHTKVAYWWSPSTGWNIPASFARNFPTVSSAIQQIEPSSMDDTRVWKLTPSGNYSILSYYENFRVIGPRVS